MARKIDSSTFFQYWKEKIEEEINLDINLYGDTTEFTKFILQKDDVNKCVMQKICKDLYNIIGEKDTNITSMSINEYDSIEYPEYFKIDYTVWDNYRKSEVDNIFKKFNLNRHCSRMILAMEHENDKEDWTDEFAKLFSVHCDLRVVVGYYDYSKLDREEKKWDEFLNFLKDITLKMIPNTEKFYGEYLLILGLPKDKLKLNCTSKDISEGYIGFKLVIDKKTFHWEEL